MTIALWWVSKPKVVAMKSHGDSQMTDIWIKTLLWSHHLYFVTSRQMTFLWYHLRLVTKQLSWWLHRGVSKWRHCNFTWRLFIRHVTVASPNCFHLRFIIRQIKYIAFWFILVTETPMTSRRLSLLLGSRYLQHLPFTSVSFDHSWLNFMFEISTLCLSLNLGTPLYMVPRFYNLYLVLKNWHGNTTFIEIGINWPNAHLILISYFVRYSLENQRCLQKIRTLSVYLD